MNEFTDSEFMSAKDKELVLKQWQSFLKGDLVFKRFRKRLYSHLTQQCSFVAHYSRGGFWAHYFGSGRETATLSFIYQFDSLSNPSHQVVEYHDAHWVTGRYQDLNLAMIAVMIEHAPRLIARAEARIKARKIELLETLARDLGFELRLKGEQP